MTPADRSNSPPIISSPTATATMPMVELWYSTVISESTDRKAGATIRKKMKRMTAATRAPTSGRASSRLDQPSWTRLEASAWAPCGAALGAVAVAGAAAGSAVVGAESAAGGAPEGADLGSWLMLVSLCRFRVRGLAAARGPGRRNYSDGSAGVVLGEREDDVDVGAVDERGAGQHRLTAAHVVAVLLVQVERGHGEVALDVGLLVDRELDLAVLDGLGRLGVEVEGDQLGLAAGLVHRLEGVEGDRCTEGDDVVDRRVGGELGLQGRDDRGVVGAVDLDVLGAGRLALHTGTAGLEGHRAGGLDDAERVLRAVGHDALTGAGAGQVLVGAEVHQRAGVLVLVDARVEGDRGDLGRDGRLDGALERVRGGQGGGDAVDLGVDRVLDQGGLLGRVGVVAVLQRRPGVLGGLLRTGFDLVPEGVAGGLVGDHGEGVARVAAATPRAAGGVVALLCAAAAAGGEDHGCGGCDRGRRHRLPESALIHGGTVSFRGYCPQLCGISGTAPARPVGGGIGGARQVATAAAGRLRHRRRRERVKSPRRSVRTG